MTAALVERLVEGRLGRQASAPLSESTPDLTLEQAYGLQRQLEQALVGRGERVVGYKVGFTTAALSAIILRVAAERPDLEGLYHVSAAAIDKHDLLGRVNRAFGAGVAIAAKVEPRIDRALDSARFQAATGIAPPSWDAMIADLAGDATPYETLRGGPGA